MKYNKIFKLISLFILMNFVSLGQTTVTDNTQGTHDGYFYSFWEENGANQASMTLHSDGRYTTTWDNVGNFTAGKGWAIGSKDRVVCFEGSYDGGNNGFLAVYGWTKNPLVEYYVVESHGQWDPPGNTSDIEQFGSFESDGGIYDLYTSLRTDKPSIIGTATFQQFWSVRRTKRATGTVTFANHVNEWEKYGVILGTTWDYQIMESEGYGSSGSSDITVWECETCEATAPQVTSTTIDYELNDLASQLSANGTNLTWYSSENPTIPLNDVPTPNTSETGVTIYYVTQTPGDCESPKTEIAVRVSQTYKILKVSTPPIIDGVLDNQWTNGNIEELSAAKVLVGQITNETDVSGTAKLLWDDSYIYVLAMIKDDSKINDSENSYEDDAIEFYFDINNDKSDTYGINDVQYSFGWNDGTNVKALPEGRSTSGIEFVAVTTTDGYVIEGRIPWSTLLGTPSSNQLIGLDFMINDDDDGTERDAKLSWNASEDQAWQDASLFGTAILSDATIVTGVDDFFFNSISIFPNPATNYIVIDGLNNEFNYKLTGLLGLEVEKGKTSSNIDVSNVENGLYHLTLSRDKVQKTFKIIISK